MIPLQEYTLEELRNNLHLEISTISIEEPQKVNGYSSEFLLHFLKVIITANLFLASFTDC